MAYADLDSLKARLNLTGSAYDALLQDALDWAQGYINDATHRTFEATAGTVYKDAKSLDPADRSILWVDDDLLSVGTLLNGDDDATEIGSAAYMLWPRNETPHYGIKLKSGTSWEFATDGFVEIVGNFGYSTTADSVIKMKALRLAEWGYRNKDMLETVTPFSDSLTTKQPLGFPLEVDRELAQLARLAR